MTGHRIKKVEVWLQALNRLLQNIYLILDFLQSKRNLLFTTAVDSSMFYER